MEEHFTSQKQIQNKKPIFTNHHDTIVKITISCKYRKINIALEC